MRYVPPVDLWSCDFECENDSSLNLHYSSPVGSTPANQGRSGQTANGRLAYIRAQCPPIVILKHVRNSNMTGPKGQSELDVLIHLSDQMGYYLVAELLNARHYRCP